jgi:hypothetical protein
MREMLRADLVQKKFKKAATPNPVALALLESNPAAASFPHS